MATPKRNPLRTALHNAAELLNAKIVSTHKAHRAGEQISLETIYTITKALKEITAAYDTFSQAQERSGELPGADDLDVEGELEQARKGLRAV